MPIYEGNTVEEATSRGLKALQLTKDDVEVTVLSDAKKGFLGIGKKAAQVSIEPTVSEEIAEAVQETVEELEVAEELAESKAAAEQLVAAEGSVSVASTSASKQNVENLEDEAAIKELAVYLTNITRELNAPAMVRVERASDHVIFHLDSDKQGILIGKHGKVLNALQYLAQVYIHRAAASKLSVVVNAGDYREKRQAILKRLAERTAEKVKRTGQPVFLEPMPAFERKQIHFALSKDEHIKTHSEGDEPHRYLVVEPAKKYY